MLTESLQLDSAPRRVARLVGVSVRHNPDLIFPLTSGTTFGMMTGCRDDMGIYIQKDRNGIVRYFIQGHDSWDDFALIIEKVQQSMKATVVTRVDGPDSRLCILSIDGHEINIVHDDLLGNFFFSQDMKAQAGIQAISAIFSDSNE